MRDKFQDIYVSDAYSLTFQPHLHNLIECIYVADGEIEVQIGQTGKCMEKRGDGRDISQFGSLLPFGRTAPEFLRAFFLSIEKQPPRSIIL